MTNTETAMTADTPSAPRDPVTLAAHLDESLAHVVTTAFAAGYAAAVRDLTQGARR